MYPYLLNSSLNILNFKCWISFSYNTVKFSKFKHNCYIFSDLKIPIKFEKIEMFLYLVPLVLNSQHKPLILTLIFEALSICSWKLNTRKYFSSNDIPYSLELKSIHRLFKECDGTILFYKFIYVIRFAWYLIHNICLIPLSLLYCGI